MAESSTTTSNGHRPAFDMTSISSGDDLNDDGEPQTLKDVPKQKSYRGVVLNDDDRELRCWGVALLSKGLFLASTCMLLWMAIDNLYWSYEAQRIPATVLYSDDAVTWNTYRTSQQASDSSSSSTASTTTQGYVRTPKNSNQEDEDEEDGLTWSQFRENNNNNRWLQNNEWSIYTPWDDLPFRIQIAAATLGYSQETWDHGGATFSDVLLWDQLSIEEQEAATTLGYTSSMWDKFRKPNSNNDNNDNDNNVPATSSASSVASSVTASTSSIWNHRYWNQYLWSVVPPEVQEQAQLLGHDQSSWDNNQRTSVMDVPWNELSPEQQQAAIAFGYTEEDWDSQAVGGTSTNSGSTSTATSNTNNEQVDWMEYSWNDLPITIQLQAILLGYTQDSWNAKSRLAVDRYPWNELSTEQQKAAFSVFGYDEARWQAEYLAANSNTNWQDTDWDDLPPTIQEQAEVLGYTRTTWDQGAPLATDQYQWEDLSPEQHMALGMVFGLTEDTWNNTSDESTVASAVAPSNRKNHGAGRAGGRGAADDDFAFVVGRENPVWVSNYQIVAFVAALLLVTVGILDCHREQRWYHLSMIIAGIAALLSAMFVETNGTLSGIFHVLSTHGLLAQAVAALFHRKSLHDMLSRSFSNALWLGDGSFAFGALLQSILSYVYFQEGSQHNQDLARASVVAALCLVLTAIVYLMTTIALCRKEKN